LLRRRPLLGGLYRGRVEGTLSHIVQLVPQNEAMLRGGVHAAGHRKTLLYSRLSCCCFIAILTVIMEVQPFLAWLSESMVGFVLWRERGEQVRALDKRNNGNRFLHDDVPRALNSGSGSGEK
jgi:hypothetical protein